MQYCCSWNDSRYSKISFEKLGKRIPRLWLTTLMLWVMFILFRLVFLENGKAEDPWYPLFFQSTSENHVANCKEWGEEEISFNDICIFSLINVKDHYTCRFFFSLHIVFIIPFFFFKRFWGKDILDELQYKNSKPVRDDLKGFIIKELKEKGQESKRFKNWQGYAQGEVMGFSCKANVSLLWRNWWSMW